MKNESAPLAPDFTGISHPSLSTSPGGNIPALTPRQIFARRLGWGFLFLFSFLFFSYLKISDHVFRSTADSKINEALRQFRLSLTSQDLKVNFGVFGISVIIDSGVLADLDGNELLKVKKGVVRPSLLGLALGKMKLDFDFEFEKGQLEGNIALPIKMGSNSKIATTIEINDLGIGESKLFSGLGLQDASGELEGEINFEGTPGFWDDAQASFQLEMTNFKAPAQVLQIKTPAGPIPLSIPGLGIAKSNLEAEMEKGTLTISKGSIGNMNGSDDIAALVTGKIQLQSNTLESKPDLRINLKFSEIVSKSFGIIETFLSPGKKSDGSFAYSLTGSLAYPSWAPLN